MADLKLVLQINADGTATIKTLNQVSQAADQVGKQSKTAGDTATRSFAATAQGAISLQGEVDRIRSGIIKVAVAAGAVHLARNFTAEVIDASSKLQGWRQGLEAATRSAAKGADELVFVREESHRLGTFLVENASSYTKLTAAARGTNLEGENTRKIFSAVSEAGRVLNLSNEQVGGALTAIEQMMSKGNVQAEELRGQLGERLPGAFGIAAEAMGVTTQQLNKMLENGQVLAEDLLPKLADRLHELYGAAAVSAANTPAAEFERLRTALFELYAAVGDAGFMAALASGSRSLAEALTDMVESGALDKIATGVALIGVASLASFGGSTLTAIQKYVAGLGTAVAAQSAMIEMEQLSAAASAKTAAAKSVDIARTLEVIQVARAEVVAKAALAQSDIVLAQRHLAAATAAGVQSFALREQRIATEQLIAAQARHAALTTELAALGRAQAGVQASLSAAATAQVAAQTRVTASLAATGVAMTALRGIGSSLLGLLGGWPGVALLAVGSLVYLATRATETSEELDRLQASTEALEDRTLSLTDAMQLLATGVEPPKSSLLELKEAQLEMIQTQLAAMPVLERWIRLQGDAGTAVNILRGEINDLREAQAKLGVANLKAEWSDRFREGVTVIRGAIDAAVNWRDTLKTSVQAGSAALDEQAAKLEKNAREVGKSKAQIWEMAAAEELLAQATKLSAVEGSEAYRLLASEIDKKYARVIAAATADDAATEAEKRKNEALRESSKTTEETAKSAADYVAGLQKQVAVYGMTAEAQARYEFGLQTLTPAQRELAGALIDQVAAWDKLAAVNEKAADALATLRSMQKGAADDVADMRAKLGGASAAQIAFNKTQRDAAAAYAIAAAAMDPSALDAYVKAITAAREKLNLSVQVDNQDASTTAIDNILSRLEQKSPFQQAIDDIKQLQQSLENLGDPLDAAFDQGRADQLTAAIKKTRIELATTFLGAARESLQSLQSLTTEGSRSFQTLQLAIDATTLAEAVLAVVHAATAGDPYTAIARMAAVAAALASIGVDIGNISSSGFSDTAAERQASQGTGSVLGDPTADSESIANGVEITANAVEKLVAINRGMLNALNTLVAGLGSAANLLARGAGNADFSGFNLSDEGNLSIWEQNDVLGRLIGGSSKITDEGIIIFAAALNDLLDGIAVGAYQEVQSRSSLFGSTHTNEAVVDVSEAFSEQFQLVIGSIVDTVRAGALAIGVLPADIEAAIAAYRIEETRISLKDLTAEEKQAELQAVFSQMFDGLAGAVVPFLPQFQRVGEGLGETLVRVATEVQVMQEATRYLGLAIDETDPERFAQIADGLIQAAGGIDTFIGQMTSFADKFAPESFRFEVASESLIAALAQAGLTVPATAEGMWELMQSLDATTEQGREQIVTLLRLSDVAGEYYQLLDKQVSEATKYLESLGLAAQPMSAFAASIMDIRASGLQAVESANIIAQAQGREGASAIQLARIHQWTADQINAAIRKLMQQTQDLQAQLFGGVPASLDLINSRIAELEGITGGISEGIGSIEDASASLFEAWKQGIQTVQDYLDSMLVGPLSALSPEEQLAVAQQQLIAMQQLAVGGDANALAQLPQLADTFLQLLQGSGASGADFETGFQWVRDLLTSVVDMQNPGTAAGVEPPPVELVPSDELRALYEARDAAEAAANAEQRAEWARQLTQNLADLATIMRVPILDLIEARGLDLRELAEALGVDFENLGAQSVGALGFLASTLGISMTELTGQLDLSLVDLRSGLTEMAANVGVDLSALTVETTQTLAALAGSLGMNLAELTTSLGVSLGDIADAQSLLNQALGAEIGSLPADQAAQLGPLFEAIAEATNEADANAAIAALEDAVNTIGGETANELAPYLANVFPVSALSQLDYLGDIQAIAAQQLDVLGLILDNMRAANIGAGVPSYAIGTGYVQGNQLANIHDAEAVVPAHVNAWFRTANWQLPRTASNDDGATFAELRALREEVAALRRENSAGQNKIAQNVDDGNSKARIQREDLARRKESGGRSPG